MEHIIKKVTEKTNELVLQGRTSEAMWCLENVATEVLNMLGLLNLDHGSSKESLRLLNMASQVKRCNWSIFNNIAHVCNSVGDYAMAEEYGRRACKLCAKQCYNPHYNLGVILSNLKKYKEAIDSYRRGVTINPHHASMRHNLATCLLVDGQFEEGWSEYEYRLLTGDRTQDMYNRFSKFPQWDGKPLDGKKLMIYSEQGLGDLIHFSRWIPQIEGDVVLECQQAALDILENSLGLVNAISRDDSDWAPVEELPKFDVVIPVCSLGNLFKAAPENTPNKPYLRGIKKNSSLIPDNDKKKIGICWAGSYGHRQDHDRSVHLAWFREIGEIPDVQLYSLQKSTIYHRQWNGQNVNLLDDCGNMDVIDLESEIHTLQDVANMMIHMDLIITVDTALAHLAGALGLPVWVIIPYIPDWRWGHTGDTTFWYPSMRLIRQGEKGDWSDVFATIKRSLAHVG